MKSSLVVRQIVLVCVITAASFAVMAWLVHRSTRAVFEHEVEESVGAPPQSAHSLVEEIQQRLRTGGEASMCRAVEERVDKAMQLLVVRQNLSVACATTADFRAATVTMGQRGGLEVAVTTDSSLLELYVAQPTELWRTEDYHFGWLLLWNTTENISSGDIFAWEVWRDAGIWLALVAATAVGATAVIMRYSLRPIDQLVDAAQKIRIGEVPDDLPQNAGVSEFRHLFDTFKSAAKSIADLEHMRRQLISDISHELRTPVTNIKAQLEAVESGLAHPDKDFVLTLTHETRLLERLVQDFQQIALSDAGHLRLSLQPLPLHDTLNNILEPMVQSIGAALDNSVTRDIVVMADEERLRQVLRNLFDNAARHRPERLFLSVSATVSDMSVCVVFRDNGPGIPEHDQPFVFERFYRAEKSRSRATGGAGLGLTICKALVEAMHGNIRLDDTVQEGTAFAITLPGRNGSKPIC